MRRFPVLRAASRAAFGALLAWCAFLAAASPAAADVPLRTADPTPSPVPSASAEPQLATFGVTAASGGQADGRSYISMAAAPGSVIYDSIAVVNQSNTPLDLEVYSADAINDAAGSVGLPDRTVTPTDAGSWITVGSSKVTVPGQSSAGRGAVLVPIAVAIPAEAEPGDHLAGVVVSLTSQGSAANGDHSATVNLEQRVGLRVYVTVYGQIAPGLTVTDVHADYHQGPLLGLVGPGSATVRYTLTNVGNTRVAVRAVSIASGLFGLVEAQVTGDQVDELLPRASVTQTVQIARMWPTVLDRVTVDAAVTTPIAGSDPSLRAPSAAVWMWAVPWAWIAVVLVLVGLLLLYRRARRRRTGARRTGAGSGDGGAPAAAGPTSVTAPDVAGPSTGEARPTGASPVEHVPHPVP